MYNLRSTSIKTHGDVRIPRQSTMLWRIQPMTSTSVRCQTSEPRPTGPLFYATRGSFPTTVQAQFC